MPRSHFATVFAETLRTGPHPPWPESVFGPKPNTDPTWYDGLMNAVSADDYKNYYKNEDRAFAGMATGQPGGKEGAAATTRSHRTPSSLAQSSPTHASPTSPPSSDHATRLPV